MNLKHQGLPLGKDRPAPEATIWATSTDLAGSEFERKTYFITLKDGDKTTQFSLQVHADKTIVAVPYVPADYNYTDYDYDDGDDDDDYVAEEDWDDCDEDDGVIYYG
jgi:hypothetical protein